MFEITPLLLFTFVISSFAFLLMLKKHFSIVLLLTIFFGVLTAYLSRFMDLKNLQILCLLIMQFVCYGVFLGTRKSN
ncbi:hypothetical protein EM59_019150 [Vibrio parahaemolyticus]|nr:hypothetical protein EM59_019150 [Vibrio parahaemolyticus]